MRRTRYLKAILGGNKMVEKIKISNVATENLDFLSRKLDLRRNIICRLAVSKSLNISNSILNFKIEDNNGREFNKYTLTGDKDIIYKALIMQHENKKIDEEEYVTIYLRNHIERGLSVMKKEYEKINSPTDYLVGLSI